MTSNHVLSVLLSSDGCFQCFPYALFLPLLGLESVHELLAQL